MKYRGCLVLQITLAGVCTVALLHPARAQAPPPDTLPPAASVPASSPPAALDVSPGERRYFELGTTLARGTFAYAALGSDAGRVERSHVRAKVAALAALAPEAARARTEALTAFTRAAQIMQDLNAPAPILSPIARLAARLSRPLPLTADARAIVSLNADAATVLSALNESSIIAHVTDDHALTRWLSGSAERRSGPVWYAEGAMAGVAETAAAQDLPELLPPLSDLATDLRGLRDWLALRVPDNPSPDLAALEADINDFLQQSAKAQARMRGSRAKALTPAQVQQLGDISRLLQAQILVPVPASDAPAQP